MVNSDKMETAVREIQKFTFWFQASHGCWNINSIANHTYIFMFGKFCEHVICLFAHHQCSNPLIYQAYCSELSLFSSGFLFCSVGISIKSQQKTLRACIDFLWLPRFVATIHRHSARISSFCPQLYSICGDVLKFQVTC